MCSWLCMVIKENHMTLDWKRKEIVLGMVRWIVSNFTLLTSAALIRFASGMTTLECFLAGIWTR